MNTVAFGWECDNMNNNGANMGMLIKRPITIRGFQADCSMVSGVATPGVAMVLFDCVAYPDENNIQGPPPHVYLGEIPNSDFHFDPVYNFNDATRSASGVGGSAHGSAGGGGRLFACIAKIWVPEATSRVISQSGLSIPLAENAQILFHMDHAGIGPCDGEMQGVFYYD